MSSRLFEIMKIIKPIIIVLIAIISISCSQEKKENKEKQSTKESSVDKEYLITVLDTIWRTEQEPIRLRDSIGRIDGYESKEFQKQQEICDKNHRINEKKVIEILENQGWLNEIEVGERGSLTICNVIQHSSNEIRLKYLPLMRDAVSKKKITTKVISKS